MPRGRRQGKGHGRGRRRWGRRMRIIEPMMLLLLAEQPAHGYKLAERLTDVFGVRACRRRRSTARCKRWKIKAGSPPIGTSKAGKAHPARCIN